MRKNALDDSVSVLVLIEYRVSRLVIVNDQFESNCKNDGHYDGGNDQYAREELVFLLFRFLPPASLNLGCLLWAVFVDELAKMPLARTLFGFFQHLKVQS